MKEREIGRTFLRRDISRREVAAMSLALGLGGAGAAAAEDTSISETDVEIKTPDGVCDARLFTP